MVLDDDPCTRETLQQVIAASGVRVITAHNSESALTAARAAFIDLALIDWNLGTQTGFDVIRSLSKHAAVPWILMSGFLDVKVAAEAGRLGALDVVALPFDADSVVATALARIRSSSPWPSLRPLSSLPLTGSRFHRWINVVRRGYSTEEDPATIALWAQSAALGYSTLTATCRAVHLDPRHSRDFTRMMRAFHLAGGDPRAVDRYVNADSRTLRQLLSRAGIRNAAGACTCVSFESYLAGQQFVPQGHLVLDLLRASDE
jgi:ActR/RegA family two-component response regulator